MRFVVNRRAGHGDADQLIRRLKGEIGQRGLDCEFLETAGPGHARELAGEAARSGAAEVVAVGGDGTISEVVNGLIGSRSKLGIIAVGTGNDVARTLSLPRNDPARALEVILQGRTRWIDIGRESNRYFISLVGVGFPADVAQTANSLRRLHGSAAFFAAVYRCLLRMRAVKVQLTIDGNRQDVECTSILIQNTVFTGGGLKVAPGADMGDGWLDILLVDKIGRLDLMINFPRLYLGRHLTHRRFKAFRGREVEIRSSERVGKTIDGNPAGTTPVRANILPRAIEVFVGEDRPGTE